MYIGTQHVYCNSSYSYCNVKHGGLDCSLLYIGHKPHTVAFQRAKLLRNMNCRWCRVRIC